MAERVFVHVGLPKTATTYLQTLIWGAQAQLAAEGVLLPGSERREHLWVSRIVRDDIPKEGMTPWQAGAWDRVRTATAAWPGTVLISHEFFAAATAEQAHDMLAALAGPTGAEVHLVLTAREPLGLFAASWQESLKNKETATMSAYSAEVSDSPRDIWNWRTLDLALVLRRWAPEGGPVRPEHVHVLPLPGKDHAREEIWHRFATLIGLDSGAYDLSGHFPNQSMGVAQAETLRRINAQLSEFTLAIDKGTYIRTFLADERLVPRGGDRFWPDAEQVEDCRRRGREAVALIQERGYDLVGDLADLEVPDPLPERRHPDDVTDAEVAAVAVELVATMLGDVRSLRHERRRLSRALARTEQDLTAERAIMAREHLRTAVQRRWRRGLFWRPGREEGHADGPTEAG